MRLVYNPDIGFRAYEELGLRLTTALGTIRLVGSKEVADLAEKVFESVTTEANKRPLEEGGEPIDTARLSKLKAFEEAARRDLAPD